MEARLLHCTQRLNQQEKRIGPTDVNMTSNKAEARWCSSTCNNKTASLSAACTPSEVTRQNGFVCRPTAWPEKTMHADRTLPCWRQIAKSLITRTRFPVEHFWSQYVGCDVEICCKTFLFDTITLTWMIDSNFSPSGDQIQRNANSLILTEILCLRNLELNRLRVNY